MATATDAPRRACGASSEVYRRGGEDVVVLDGLDLDVAPGEFLALMGPSGSGKSTILNLIGGLDRADAGTIEVGGTEISTLCVGRPRGLARAPRRVRVPGLQPDPGAHGARERRAAAAPDAALATQQRREHAEYALELVGLTDRMDHRPKQLSGGQEQRVAIARAIATDPTMILADEPTGDLDRASADAVLDILSRLVAENGKTDRHGHARPRRRARAPRARSTSRRACSSSSRDRSGARMSLLQLVHRNLWRHPVRSCLTFGFSALALFLFVFLRSVVTTLDAAREGGRDEPHRGPERGEPLRLHAGRRTARRSSRIPGRRVDRPVELVRRLLPGRVELLRAVRRRPRRRSSPSTPRSRSTRRSART